MKKAIKFAAIPMALVMMASTGALAAPTAPAQDKAPQKQEIQQKKDEKQQPKQQQQQKASRQAQQQQQQQKPAPKK